MKNITHIKKENIRDKVISEIKKAKKEILATLEVTEEIRSPLPKSYFLLLSKKKKEGLKINRVVFGSKKVYYTYLKDHKLKKIPFNGKHTVSKNYKRMIMIDGAKLFFSRKISGKNKFYFTVNPIIVQDYKRYFKKLY